MEMGSEIFKNLRTGPLLFGGKDRARVQDFDRQIQGIFKDYSRTKRTIFKVNPVWP